jgi:hypothetical protein
MAVQRLGLHFGPNFDKPYLASGNNRAWANALEPEQHEPGT